MINFLFLIVDVEIRWHDRDSLAISPIHREDFGIGGRAKYEVSVACLLSHFLVIWLALAIYELAI